MKFMGRITARTRIAAREGAWYFMYLSTAVREIWDTKNILYHRRNSTSFDIFATATLDSQFTLI